MAPQPHSALVLARRQSWYSVAGRYAKLDFPPAFGASILSPKSLVVVVGVASVGQLKRPSTVRCPSSSLGYVAAPSEQSGSDQSSNSSNPDQRFSNGH
jgi:hypothetical protein